MPTDPEPHSVGGSGTSPEGGPPDGPALGRHRLGPHVVGQRVVIRHVVPGETGPSGGPALNDVLGVCTAWGQGVVRLTRHDGSLVEVAIADIVSGKPVPPRASVRHRVPPREAHLHSLAMWPEVETGRVGEWVLRSTGSGLVAEERLVARANSALAMDDPGLPWPEAAEAVAAFYAARGRPVWAQVVADGEVDRALQGLGWVPARPGEADTLFQVAPVSRALRATHAGLVTPAAAPRPGKEPVRPRYTEEGDPGRERVLVELLGPDAAPRAQGRAALDADWVGIHAVRTDPAHRRQGLGVAVMAELLDWAASRGATTVYLQVRADNGAALGLYQRLGFWNHHTYRYLALPGTLP